MLVFLSNYLQSSSKNSTITTRNDAPYWSAPRLLIGQLQHLLLVCWREKGRAEGTDMIWIWMTRVIIYSIVEYSATIVCYTEHQVHTEWPLPFSGVHSIMMEKIAQSGEGGCVRPPLSLYLPSRTKLWCTLMLRGQVHSSYFYSTPICTLWSSIQYLQYL